MLVPTYSRRITGISGLQAILESPFLISLGTHARNTRNNPKRAAEESSAQAVSQLTLSAHSTQLVHSLTIEEIKETFDIQFRLVN